MTVKEVKQFFRNIRRGQQEIQQLKEIIQAKEMSLIPRGLSYEKDKVMVSPEDKFSEVCAKVADLQVELGKSIYLLAQDQIRAEQYIRQLEDANERKVMRSYYLTLIDGELPTWNQVAIRMNYYERYVKKIHGDALVSLSRIM